MDPITLGILTAAGIAGLVAFLRPKAQAPKAGCDAGKAAVNTVGATVSGAGAGASGGPYGAAAGAGLGLALGATSSLSGPCGTALVKNIGKLASQITKTTCEKADEAYAELKSHGGSIPGYSSLSCEQRLAAIAAAAASMGITLVALGAAVGAAERTYDNVTDTTTKVGGGHATVGGHKVF